MRGTAEDLIPDQISSAEFQKFINDMIETMREYGGVGLAAPQVHQSLQIAVIEFKNNPRLGIISSSGKGED